MADYASAQADHVQIVVLDPWCAEKVSWIRHARTPDTLFATTKHQHHFRRWPRPDPRPRKRLHGPKAQQNLDSRRPASARRRQSRAHRSQPAQHSHQLFLYENLRGRRRPQCVSALPVILLGDQALSLSSKACARLQQFSAVNPNSHINTGPIAETPKWSMPITSPPSPM